MLYSTALPENCPENYGSALLCSRTLTENSVSVLLCSSALTDSPPGFPASNLGSKNKAMGKIKLFPTRERIETHPKLEFHVRHASIANVLDIMRK